jgi:RNA polymerase sigma-70 factor, ECF subfamily
VGGDGQLVTLNQQDRSRWDQRNIHEGTALLEKAFQLRQIGPYQIQAAISALHVSAASAGETDWRQIAGLYNRLLRFQDTAIIRLNLAVAVSMYAGPAQGLSLVQELTGELDNYAPFHLARADMLQRLEKWENARQAYEQALGLTKNQTEQAFILDQIQSLKEPDRGNDTIHAGP